MSDTPEWLKFYSPINGCLAAVLGVDAADRPAVRIFQSLTPSTLAALAQWVAETEPRFRQHLATPASAGDAQDRNAANARRVAEERRRDNLRVLSDYGIKRK